MFLYIRNLSASAGIADIDGRNLGRIYRTGDLEKYVSDMVTRADHRMYKEKGDKKR